MAKSSKTVSKGTLNAHLKTVLKPSKDLVTSITSKLRAQKLKKSDSVPAFKTPATDSSAASASKLLSKLGKQLSNKTASLAKSATAPKLRLK